MQVVKKYFYDIKNDVDVLLNPVKKETKAIHDERIKSLALRIGGGVAFVGTATAFVMSVFSVLSFSPVNAVGWITIGVAAGVFGHDLVKMGNNSRDKMQQMINREKDTVVLPEGLADRHPVNLHEEALLIKYAVWLSMPKKEITSDLLKGTVAITPLCNAFNKVKKFALDYRAAQAA